MFIILPSRYLYTIFLKNNKPHTPNIYTTILSKCIFSFHLPPTDTHLLFFTKKIFVSFLHFLYYIEWFFESAYTTHIFSFTNISQQLLAVFGHARVYTKHKKFYNKKCILTPK